MVADKFVSKEAILAFKSEMDQAGADYQFISYDGALHGFTSPDATANGEKFGLPLAYNKEADEASWKSLQGLLTQVFAK